MKTLYYCSILMKHKGCSKRDDLYKYNVLKENFDFYGQWIELEEKLFLFFEGFLS